MRSSILNIVALTFALTGKVLAFDDFPQQCQSVCSSLGQAEDRCDEATNDNSPEYTSCLCNASGAREAIQLCEACWYQQDRLNEPDDNEQEWRDNDANRLLGPCSLQALTTYDLATPSPTQTVVAFLTTSGTDTFVRTDVPTSTPGPTTATTGTDTATTTITSSTSGTGSGSSTTSTSTSDNAAPTAGVGSLSFMAGAGLLAAAALM